MFLSSCPQAVTGSLGAGGVAIGVCRWQGALVALARAGDEDTAAVAGYRRLCPRLMAGERSDGGPEHRQLCCRKKHPFIPTGHLPEQRRLLVASRELGRYIN